MRDAAAAGFRFGGTMGGDTAFGGNEVVVLMTKAGGAAQRYEYRLLATTKTSTMQRELQEAAAAGFEYRGQSVFSSMFGGKEVVVISGTGPRGDRQGPVGVPPAGDEQDLDDAARAVGHRRRRLRVRRHDRRLHGHGRQRTRHHHAPQGAVANAEFRPAGPIMSQQDDRPEDAATEWLSPALYRQLCDAVDAALFAPPRRPRRAARGAPGQRSAPARRGPRPARLARREPPHLHHAGRRRRQRRDDRRPPRQRRHLRRAPRQRPP